MFGVIPKELAIAALSPRSIAKMKLVKLTVLMTVEMQIPVPDGHSAELSRVRDRRNWPQLAAQIKSSAKQEPGRRIVSVQVKKAEV